MRLNPTRSRHGATRLLIAACCTLAAIINASFTMTYGGDSIQWMSDGRGSFQAPDAPTHWSRETGIAWKSDLPATSISSPILADERAFAMAEPNRLLCFRLRYGELLWDRSYEYDVVFGPEKANEIKQLQAESHKVHQVSITH